MSSGIVPQGLVTTTAWNTDEEIDQPQLESDIHEILCKVCAVSQFGNGTLRIAFESEQETITGGVLMQASDFHLHAKSSTDASIPCEYYQYTLEMHHAGTYFRRLTACIRESMY